LPDSVSDTSQVSQFTPTCPRAPLAVGCCYEAEKLKQKLVYDTGSIQATLHSILFLWYYISQNDIANWAKFLTLSSHYKKNARFVYAISNL